MAIIIPTARTAAHQCYFCGTPFHECGTIYRCDDCGKAICEECLPEPADPDCPNEFCEECINK